MKKLLAFVLLFFMFSGVIFAASINGEFNGNPIVKVKSNGKELKVEKTPAVIYNNNTLVPIYMLKELGANVNWDQGTYSVNVSFDSNNSNNEDNIVISKKKIIELENKVSKLGGLSFKYIYAGGLSTFTEVIYHSNSNDINNDIVNIASISKLFLETDIGIVKIEYYVNNVIDEEVYIFRKNIEDYQNGVTNMDAFFHTWSITSVSTASNKVQNNTNLTPIVKSYPELYSNDGKEYLGKLTTNSYDSDSIFNEYGTYGSKYETKSIWNNYGDYGSAYSSISAFNKFATEPPAIISDGEIIGYLTINSTIKGAISPYGLLKWLEDLGY